MTPSVPTTHLDLSSLSYDQKDLGALKALLHRADEVQVSVYLLERVKRIAHREQIALDDPMRIEDRAARTEAVGEDQRGAFVFHRTPAVGEQCAGADMDRDREPAAHDALRREARPKVRTRLGRYAQRLHGLVRSGLTRASGLLHGGRELLGDLR